jgi:hypothetical protein
MYLGVGCLYEAFLRNIILYFPINCEHRGDEARRQTIGFQFQAAALFIQPAGPSGLRR